MPYGFLPFFGCATAPLIKDPMKIPLNNQQAGDTPKLIPKFTSRVGIGRFALRILTLIIFISIPALRSFAQAPQTAGQNTGSAAADSGTNSPESRGDELKKKREEKAKDLLTPKEGIVEKYAKNFDRKGNNSIEDLNFWGFHPRLDWIARGSGAALGVRYWRPEALGPADVMGAAFYSWRRYQLYDLQLGLIPNQGKRIPPRTFEAEGIEQFGDIEQGKFERFKLYVSGRFRDRTDESYYGQGPDSLQENQTHYRIKDTLVEAVMGVQITRRMGFTVKAGQLNNTLAKGRSGPNLQPEDYEVVPPGIQHPPNYFRSHVSFMLDFRDNPGLPHKGVLVTFGWEKFDNVTGDNQFNFNRFGIDSRAYIPLGSNQQVIALRALGIDSDPAPGNVIPFFLQPSLGGGESLRGYDPYRFQGDKLILLQGEYRWEASRRIELAIFGDTGTVANHGSRLSINEMKSDAGFGFRLKSSRTTLFRLDIARSNEGFHFQFRFSPVF
jgi:hypothetical protein